MSMMKRIFYLFILLILLSTLTACTRDRFRRGTDDPTLAVEPSFVATMVLMPSDTSIPEQATSAPGPTIAPSQTPQPAQSQPSAAAAASAELDGVLTVLEKLLGEMDTNITVP
jgi:hypothetical protein